MQAIVLEIRKRVHRKNDEIVSSSENDEKGGAGFRAALHCYSTKVYLSLTAWPSADWAAARRATGTRKGEHET